MFLVLKTMVKQQQQVPLAAMSSAVYVATIVAMESVEFICVLSIQHTPITMQVPLVGKRKWLGGHVVMSMVHTVKYSQTMPF